MVFDITTAKEAGKRGGISTVYKFGIACCEECGQPIKTDYMSNLGQKGAAKAHALHDSKFYSECGRKGGRGNKKN